MKNYLVKLPPEFDAVIKQAVLVSGQINMAAYLVGGFLRDLILGVKNWDLDLMVEGDGIVFAQRLAEGLNLELRKHERFKTATLILSPVLKVDVAMARSESYSGPAMLPSIVPGSLEEDLKRRDFTINALALNINSGGQQKIIDFCGGQEDLVSGKIRVLHALSFLDDPTRILRAIRFEQRYGFKIERQTLILLKQAIALGLLEKTQAHRLRDELILMLKEDSPLKQIKRLDQLGGLVFLSKNLKFTLTGQKLFQQLNREVLWFKKNFPQARLLDTWLIYLTALLSVLSSSEIKKIVRRLGLRKGEEKRILSFAQINPKFKARLSSKKIKPAQIFALLEPLSYEVIILLRAVSKNNKLRQRVSDFFEVYNGMRLFVTGSDLHGLGVKPGPFYQKIFAKVLAAKLNAKVHNYEEELALIRNLIK